MISMKINTLFKVKTNLLHSVSVMAITMLFVAFSGCGKSGYVINGVVQGAADGDTVTLELIDNMDLIILEKAVIKDGKFTFKGNQDSVALRYLSCVTQTDVFSLPLFLENGKIEVKMVLGEESVTGTPTNDIYQEIREGMNKALNKMNEIDNDTTLTDEQREQQLDEAEIEYSNAIKSGMEKNMDNVVGIFLFKEKYYENSLSENEVLFDKIPAKFLSDEQLIGIKRQMESQKRTDINRPFTDLTLQTPDGKSVKLSDYVGKGKPVLIDFWASWCAPCRQAMPELIKLYNTYKGKFEIIGISFDENIEDWQGAITRLELPWVHVSDLKGWKSEAAMQYGIHTIPHTVLIDKNGMIVARELHGVSLESKLAEILL